MNLFDFLCLTYRKLVALFKWIFNLFLGIIHLCFRYWYVMIACVVLGFFGARLWLRPAFTRYKGYATITFAPGMKRVVEEGLVSFMSQPFDTKKNEFGLPAKTQSATRKFLVYNIIDAKCNGDADYIDKKWAISPTDSANDIMKDRLALQIDLWGRNDFEHYEKALTKWFNTQEKFLKEDRICKRTLQDRLKYVTHEVVRSDSFISHYYFSDAPQPQQINVYNSEVAEEKAATVMIHDEMLMLVNEKSGLENKLSRNPDVINFQTHFYFEALTPKQKYLTGLCTGFVLGILISLLIKYWSNVKNFILTK